MSAPMAVLATGTVIALVAPAPMAFAATRPSAPRSVAAKPGNHSVTVTWKAPGSTGGAKIDAYRVTWWKSGTTTKHTVKLGASARSYVKGSLVNGTKYAFQVAAHNRRGWGTASATRTAVPRTIPGAPTNVAGTPGFDEISITWKAPANNGAAIGKYALRTSVDAGWDWQAATTSSGTDEVTGTATVLEAPRISPWDNGIHPYLIQVRAHNAAGWGPWAYVQPAAGVVEQTPVFVPGNSQGDAAAAAFRDRLTGSYWTDGYPTPGGAGTWHDGGPWVMPIAPSCGGGTTVGCPGGNPQSPQPSFVFDFTLHPGDLDRRAVTNVAGQHRFELTYRARLATSEPVAFSASGSGDCTMTIDSTQGTVPDVTLNVPIDFPSSGWQQHASAGDVSVSNLEAADVTFGGGGVCAFLNFGTSFVVDSIAQNAADQIKDGLRNAACGTDEPHYWQPCYAVLDSPLPTPPAAPASSRCPSGPPAAGPYLTLTCDGSTVVRTCAEGWADVDGQAADGCERSTSGFVPAQVDATTDQALADHLSGSFFLGGYPGGVGTGTWFAAPNPVRVPLRPCLYSSVFGCPRNVQQSLPALQLDLADHVGDSGARREGTYNSTDDYTQLTLRGRLSLTGSVVFTQDDVKCELQIDTTQGAQPDVTFNVAAMAGNGPLTIVPFDDSSGWVTLVGFEDQDIVIGPHQWCRYYTQGRMNEVRTWVRDTLVAWAQREAALCGAPDPWFWQRCPS